MKLLVCMAFQAWGQIQFEVFQLQIQNKFQIQIQIQIQI